MGIREQEERLFQEWKGNRKGFVEDGLVSEKDYLSSNLKLVFILKEVNDRDGRFRNLRKFIYEGARPQTWNNVARWVHGIRQICDSQLIPDWKSYSAIDDRFRKQELKSICVINLKKSPGTQTTNYAKLDEAANEDKEYIQRQYSIYDPDITICAGTGDLFKWVVGHDSEKWQTTTRGIRWYERQRNRYVVSYAHPAARVSAPLLIYGLLDAVLELTRTKGVK